MTEENKENPKLEEMDRMTLELAKQRKMTAMLAAENAELSYRNVIMQLFMKYELSPSEDSIKEDTGEIIKGGALQAVAPKGT